MSSTGYLRKRQDSASFSVTLEHLAILGIYLFALSWPLGAFQRILWPIHLYHLALVPVFLCAGFDLKRNKRLRTPYELWWPCLAIFLAIVVLWFMGHAVNLLETGMLCLSFIVVAHVVRNRKMVLHTLSLFLLSTCVMMALSLLSAFRLLYPTTFNLDSRWVMAGPYSLEAGIFTIVVFVLLIPSLVFSARREEYKPGIVGRAVWVLLPLFLVLFFIVSPRFEPAFLYPWHVTFLAPAVFPVAVLLWGIARIVAKLRCASRFMEPGIYSWLIAALFVFTLLLLWAAPVPTIGYVFLLAVIAGYGQPYVVSKSETRLTPVLAGIVIIVLLVNISIVLPGDPRNYERSAQAALAQNDVDNTLKRLEFVKGMVPAESLADYYIALALLEKGELAQATQAFSRSLRDTKTRLLPPPDDAHIDLFLDGMREKSSALPETVRGLAYEKALIAAGRDRHALSLLELRGKSADAETLSSWPLATVVASILNAPQLTETLAQWNANLLATILESVAPDNKVVAAPEGFPQALLPFVAMASNDAGQDVIQVFTPQGAFGGVRISGDPHLAFVDVALAMSSPEWATWRQNEDGIWTLAFGKIAEIHIMNTPEVLFSVYPTPPTDNTSHIVIFIPEQSRP